MTRSHHYEVTVSWTGETRSYRSYERAHEVTADGKTPIAGSSDPAFRGDPARWNPEELLVASLSQCHMLWFLHLCATDGVVVTGYTDNPAGTMVESADGGGQFSEVVLRPRVELADPDQADLLPGIHERAHTLCYIARSVNFPVRHEQV
ncbi:peroxiredoxin [Actinoplanes italicus]|uniref:Organic hydroperoxide reductase OsmC/OhrA n=1 Tax=Actinoplanes italicus TaxID=113567 RepID=A0A2T0K1L7_9ACTN|nr:OsmC family protein [Actinoplanes italicus]PRX16707.1 organic hydroperoxide reductase OsmC/OhrA [Actinoplanes italicus]GIE31163.1 peroxiredoxin [Actinoplanes italicus]